ncbi:molecular chaperone TorD [Vibrio alginolyticus]|uniref:molecular chaperone TorD n=1 Tax=Vibrio sp. B1FLJ16 TaxID=2751178 RepID=UPI0015F65791|nr:molecular chaperone TorD [Vibrio sp. B1FLJ16]CAD7808342.1 Involved in the biogenesis of TorA. Acts on TorA before the insertion of the molybdenum cofactor and [Vibrio sp. B1FLJ16]CAD7809070.1 Involved in the biogenesis of TorA. Acts on TorA before the insertion of the molybdenum cofactor and [Vibrio sp. B1FLJ16]CAE6906843.1 Involved in the biogenesis of TorA. Acts on TorA before the insertion of the molybdenum cofactor and [Vibrio sp. B1FLJ16]CAE6909808.1 Involved in the biogenesis of TorA. 
MQEVKAFNEKRAEIYWWFSSLFAKELTDKDLEAYHSVEIRSFLAGLGENESLKLAVNNLVDALNRLQDREDAQLELAADFCELFLKTEKYGALPYASMYIGKSGLLNDKPAEEMAKLMADFGVQVDDKLNEPADHLAVELDFLGNMIIRSNEYEQEKHMEEAFVQQNHFIEHQLMSWLPQFSAKCHQLDEFGFYASVAQLLVAFCKLDSTYLTGE